MRINKDTLIPIGLVLSMFGGMIWLGKVINQVEAHEAALKEVRQDAKTNADYFKEISSRLSRIEAKLE